MKFYGLMSKNVPNWFAHNGFILAVMLGALIFAGCSQKRQDASSTSSVVSTSDLVDYSYPHSSGWTADHVGYLSKNQAAIKGSAKDCNSCHASMPKTAKAMNISCGLGCHTPLVGKPGATLPSKPVVNNECAKCHEGHYNRPKSHYPAAAGLCKACHEAKPEHLAGTMPKAVTTRSGEATCTSCHFKMDTHTEVHKALTAGKGCLNCHDPHGSDQKAFLKKPSVEALCMSCHQPGAKHSKSVHGVLKSEQSCLSCHSPHSSDNKKLLTASSKDLCLSCHNQPVVTVVSPDSRVIPNIAEKVAEMPFIHSPAKSTTGCVTCHDSHAAKYSRLLTKNYPDDAYSPYEPGNDKVPNTYETCFQCHDSKLLDKAGEDTEFRNDKLVNGKVEKQNLHWVHVVSPHGGRDKSRGRSCFVCHDPHGAQQVHNIKSSWRMSPSHDVTLEFTPTRTGGTCTRSCHEPRPYNRSD